MSRPTQARETRSKRVTPSVRSAAPSAASLASVAAPIAAGAAAHPAVAPALARRVRFIVQGMRPRQWTKNAPLFAGLIFSERFLDWGATARAALACVVFCLVTGATYLINDLADIERDRLHPTKRLRPLASGRLAVRDAWLGVGAALALAAGLTALLIRLPESAQTWRLDLRLWPPRLTLAPGVLTFPHDVYAQFGGGGTLFALTTLAYLALMLGYTFQLKHIVLLDVFTIAVGFVLRAMAGAFVVSVRISPWLYLCTILLALFLALNKRRQELVSLAGRAGTHRSVLSQYTLPLLDQLITIVTSATLMAYSLYTFQGETGGWRLMVTIPFVLYGVFRYLYLVYVRGEGGSPEEALLRDPHIRWSVLLYALTVGVVLYVIPV